MAGHSFGQDRQQPIDNNNPLFAALHPKVYFTTDKEIYTPGEQLWFSAYLFENNGLRQDTANILTIGLYDMLAEKMVVIKKFLIENRIATGNIFLSDTLFSGEYTLVAYTNLLDETNTPITKNFKPLRIYNRTKNQLFTTTLKIIDSLSAPDKIAVLHQIFPGSLRAPFKEVRAFYYSGGKYKKLPINLDGTGLIYINPSDINKSNRTLVVSTIYNADTIRARIELPINENRDRYTAIFSPEGGRLMADYNNTVFVELLKDNSVGTFKGVLLENGHPIDTLYTKANEQNAFTFKPRIGRQYAVAVNFGDSTIQYNLPKVMAKGVKLTLPQTVVDDVLNFELATKEKKVLKVLLTDVRGTPHVHHFTVDGQQKIKIPLNGFPRGLCNLYILDSSSNQLLANAYFFAQHRNKMNIILQSSKDTYKTRDSIELNLYLSNANGFLRSAVATVSCALSSRVNSINQKNIETDFVLDGLAYNEQSVVEQNELLKNKSLLENIIRLKNIPNHDGEIAMDDNNLKPITPFKPLVTIRFNKYGDPVRKKVKLVMFNDTKFSVVKTSKDGTVELDTEQLLLADGRRLFFKGLGKRNEGFTVFAEDALVEAHQNITIPIYKPVLRQQPTGEGSNFLFADKEEKFSKTLEEVVVKSTKDAKIAVPQKMFSRRNACGDYVCHNEILNCPNHYISPYRAPVEGERYWNPKTNATEVYTGCQKDKYVEEQKDFEESLYVSYSVPVYLPGTFVGMDSALLKQTFPSYMSTICWMPFAQITRSQHNRIVFNSSDQEGTYVITVQGFAENGQPFFAQKTITVKD